MKNSVLPRENSPVFFAFFFAIVFAVVTLLYFTATHLSNILEYRYGFYDLGLVHYWLNEIFYKGEFLAFSSASGHLMLIFYLWAPIHWLFGQEFHGFLLVHALALSAFVAVSFCYSREVLKSNRLAGLVTTALLCNVYFANLLNCIHFEYFAALFLVGFAYLATRGNVFLACVALIGALATKEDVWVYASGVLLLLTLNRISGFGKESLSKKSLMIYAFLILGYFLIILTLIYPSIYPDQNSVLLKHRFNFADSKFDLVMYLITHPVECLKTAFNNTRNFLGSFLFLPVIFTPLKSLSFLPSLYLWGNSTFEFSAMLKSYYVWPFITFFALLLPHVFLNIRTLLSKVSRFQGGRSLQYSMQILGLLFVAYQLVFWRMIDPSAIEARPFNFDILRSDRAHFISKQIKKYRENERSLLTEQEFIGHLVDRSTVKWLEYIHAAGETLEADTGETIEVVLLDRLNSNYREKREWAIGFLGNSDQYQKVLDENDLVIFEYVR